MTSKWRLTVDIDLSTEERLSDAVRSAVADLIALLPADDEFVVSAYDGVVIAWPDILAATAHTFGLEVSDLTGGSRIHGVVTARHASMYLMRSLLKMSFGEIGKVFDRDHTTVVSAVQKYNPADPSLDKVRANLKRLLDTKLEPEAPTAVAVAVVPRGERQDAARLRSAEGM